MNNTYYELINKLQEQLHNRFSGKVNVVHASTSPGYITSHFSDSFCGYDDSTTDCGYDDSTTELKLIVQELTETYGIFHETESFQYSDDPIAKLLIKKSRKIDVSCDNLLGSRRTTYRIMFTINDDDQFKELYAYISDPEWVEFSKEFDEQVESELSKS